MGQASKSPPPPGWLKVEWSAPKVLTRSPAVGQSLPSQFFSRRQRRFAQQAECFSPALLAPAPRDGGRWFGAGSEIRGRSQQQVERERHGSQRRHPCCIDSDGRTGYEPKYGAWPYSCDWRCKSSAEPAASGGWERARREWHEDGSHQRGARGRCLGSIRILIFFVWWLVPLDSKEKRREEKKSHQRYPFLSLRNMVQFLSSTSELLPGMGVRSEIPRICLPACALRTLLVLPVQITLGVLPRDPLHSLGDAMAYLSEARVLVLLY